jgi:SAM-dependent methyltransferase
VRQLFDRALLRRRRDRAAERLADHDFLFEEVAARLAERLQEVRRDFPLALDLGSHHGCLARALAPLRAQSPDKIGYLVQSDLSPAQARLAAATGNPALAADEEFLPFAAGKLDLAVSNLSLHWVNDLPGCLIQIRQALKPDGLFLAALLGGETLRELRQVLLQAESETQGGAGLRVSPFADLQDAAGLLQRAGFALPVADRDRIEVSYLDAFRLLADLRGMGEANALAERSPRPLTRRSLLRAAEIYQETHSRPDGKITASFEVLYLTAWAPAADQPQPLRPGSAKTRLAEALGEEERKAGEKAKPN